MECKIYEAVKEDYNLYLEMVCNSHSIASRNVVHEKTFHLEYIVL